MKITILTLFPEFFESFKNNSIIARAISKRVIQLEFVNIRDFTKDKYGRVDTPPIGGGAGLVMKCQPVVDAIRKYKTENSKVILLSPIGKTYNQKIAREYAEKLKDLIIVCGHYEGLDARINNYVDEIISIGDYILTGGEIAAMAISDSVIRLLDGAITEQSIVEESFENDLLEYPQFTEPQNFEGHEVPEILYTGNHEVIKKWRQKQSLVLTRKYRKDLFDKYTLTKQDKKLLEEFDSGITPKRETVALEKWRKFNKK